MQFSSQSEDDFLGLVSGNDLMACLDFEYTNKSASTEQNVFNLRNV